MTNEAELDAEDPSVNPEGLSETIDVDEFADAGAVKPQTGPTLLYIEDNMANIRLVERILDLGPKIQFLCATHGIAGLEMAELQQPDLIFLDLHLPDITGNEVLAKLVSNPATKDIPVVIMSADADPARIRHLLESGADDFITKPVDVPRVLRVLGQYMTGNPPSGEPKPS